MPPSTAKRLRASPVGTSVSQRESIHHQGFAGTTFLKPQPQTSPPKPERSTGLPKAQEDGTLTARPHRVITSLKSIVEPHSNVPRSKSSRSTSTFSPNLPQDLPCPERMLWYTLAEMMVFLAFLCASVTLFSALAGIGYIPGVGVQEMTAADNVTKGLLYPDADGSLAGLFQHRGFHRHLDLGASQKSIDALKAWEVFG